MRRIRYAVAMSLDGYTAILAGDSLAPPRSEKLVTQHPLVTYQTGRVPVHIGLGRLIAALALSAFFWFSIAGDRAKAGKDLNRLTERSYAAGYAEHRRELKEGANRSDGYLIGMAAVLLVFVVMYEGAAWAVGVGLGYVDDVASERIDASHPPGGVAGG